MKLLLSYYEPDDILRHEDYLTCHDSQIWPEENDLESVELRIAWL